MNKSPTISCNKVRTMIKFIWVILREFKILDLTQIIVSRLLDWWVKIVRKLVIWSKRKCLLLQLIIILPCVRYMHYSKTNPIRSCFLNFKSPCFNWRNSYFKSRLKKLNSVVLRPLLVGCILNSIIVYY